MHSTDFASLAYNIVWPEISSHEIPQITKDTQQHYSQNLICCEQHWAGSVPNFRPKQCLGRCTYSMWQICVCVLSVNDWQQCCSFCCLSSFLLRVCEEMMGPMVPKEIWSVSQVFLHVITHHFTSLSAPHSVLCICHSIILYFFFPGSPRRARTSRSAGNPRNSGEDSWGYLSHDWMLRSIVGHRHVHKNKRQRQGRGCIFNPYHEHYFCFHAGNARTSGSPWTPRRESKLVSFKKYHSRLTKKKTFWLHSPFSLVKERYRGYRLPSKFSQIRLDNYGWCTLWRR